ncbi:MAG: DUF3604 domain-containing protein [Pseudomonadota bacterium]
MARDRPVCRALFLLVGLLVTPLTWAERCPGSQTAEKQLLWGDLHVHTTHSLDAWAFGAQASPRDAYAFARGKPLRLANGDIKTIDRPLDFAAVTDHAETWDLMYLCTDPVYADEAYCSGLRALHRERESRRIFNDYLLPIVGSENPVAPGVCDVAGYDCTAAREKAWQRVQAVANEANEPCEFTTFIGYEWTGSPGGLHWHRNVLFASEQVTPEAYDYIRFPKVQQLWQQLRDHCRDDAGCDVLTIPHNINWADGGETFAVEDESDAQWHLRARYERLAEIYQEKGASECLPIERGLLDADCSFDLVQMNAARERLSGRDTSPPQVAWGRARSSYYRSLLGRGLRASASSAEGFNPLMLGAIGSTDTHFGTPGRVAEADYDRGISTLLASDEQQLRNPAFNPGGLVAVWAPENTRAAIFAALHRREAYATSGPRIALRFGQAQRGHCARPDAQVAVSMGGTISAAPQAGLWFVVQAAKDYVPLRTVQIIKGQYVEGTYHEDVVTVQTAERPAEGDVSALCVEWQDEAFDPDVPAYWYARVLEAPTPRWSKLLCERAKICQEYPDADRMIQERAWSSPIWWLP